MSRKEEIRENTERNLARVRNLAQIYKRDLAGKGSGRRPTAPADVLRAATVLLHSTLEDFLRDLADWKLPVASAEALADIPIAGSGRKATKFTLGELARFRGQSVDQVVSESVTEYLGQETYNNVSDIKKLLRAIGHDETKIDPFAGPVGNMMDRRHNIVHRADKNEKSGPGHYRAKSLAHGKVVRWIGCVEEFAESVLDDV